MSPASDTGPETIVRVLEWRVGEAEASLKRGAGTIGAIKSAAIGAFMTAIVAVGHGLWSAAAATEKLERAQQDVKAIAIQVETIHGRAQEQRVRIEGLAQALDYERQRAERLEGEVRALRGRR